MDIIDNERAKALLSVLAKSGSKGVRLDQVDRKLLDPTILTVLDAEKLIEFGRRNHCRTGSGDLLLERGMQWESWYRPSSDPIKKFLPKLLKTEPDVLRPWARLTTQGRFAAANLELGIGRSDSNRGARSIGEDKHAKRGPGRPSRDRERDKEMCEAWERAKGMGVKKKDFAKEYGVTVRELDNALRSRRSLKAKII